MGNRQTSEPVNRDVLDDLARTTHYNERELKQLYRQFSGEAPTGAIPKDDFHHLSRVMGIKDEFLIQRVFHAFDRNKDGEIGFDDFIVSMSRMTRGTPDDKLEFAFSMFDIHQQGFVTRDDLLEVVESLYRMLGDLVSLQGEEYDSPDKLVDKIFAEMDTDKDGRLSLEEYKAGALRDPAIVQGLALF